MCLACRADWFPMELDDRSSGLYVFAARSNTFNGRMNVQRNFYIHSVCSVAQMSLKEQRFPRKADTDTRNIFSFRQGNIYKRLKRLKRMKILFSQALKTQHLPEKYYPQSTPGSLGRLGLGSRASLLRTRLAGEKKAILELVSGVVVAVSRWCVPPISA